MLQFMQKINGSVSIFLLAIMLPMLVFSFTVVDICKIMMAEDVVADAADVGVNSALTSYDKVLKDMYGLMATSSTEEELSEKIAEYYAATLAASGVSLDKEEQGKIQTLILDLLNSSECTLTEEDINNSSSLLNIKAEELDNGQIVQVSPIAPSALSNPNVMKREIVEYMKYRGPAMIVSGMLSKINAFSDLPNQAKAAESKIEFDQSLSDIGSSSQDVYTLLRIYEHNCLALDDNPDPHKLGSLSTIYDGTKAATNESKFMDMYLVDRNKSTKYTSNVIDLKYTNYVELANRFDQYYFMNTGIDPQTRKNVYNPPDGISWYFYTKNLFLENDMICYGIFSGFFKNDFTYSSESDAKKNLKSVEKDSHNYSINIKNGSEIKELADAIDDLVESADLLYYAEFKDKKDLFPDQFYESPIGKAHSYGLLAYPEKDENVVKSFDVIKAFMALYDSKEYSGALGDMSTFPDSYKELAARLEAANDAIEEYNNLEKEDQDEIDGAIYELIASQYDAENLFDDLEELRLLIEKYAVSARIRALTSENGLSLKYVIKQMTDFYYNIYSQYALLEKLTADGGELKKIVKLYKEAEEKAEVCEQNVETVNDTSAKTSLSSQLKSDAGNLLKGEDGADLEAACNELIEILNNQKKNYKQVLSWMDQYMLFGTSLFKNVDISKDPDSKRDISKHLFDVNTITKEIFNNSSSFSRYENLLYFIEGNMIIPDFKMGAACDDIDSGAITKWYDYIEKSGIKDNKMYKQIETAAKPTHDTEKDSSVKDQIDKMGETDENGNTKAMTEQTGVSGSDSGSGSSSGSGSDDDSAKYFNTEVLEAYGIQKYSEYIAKYLEEEAETTPEPTYGETKEAKSDDKDDQTAAKASNLLSSAADFVVDLLEAGRDDLLTTEYLANVFSCHTTDMENGVLITDDAKRTRNMFGEMLPNKTNSYRGELEYILYGFDNNAKNVAAASGVIFGIRFVLNLIYTFTDAEINEITYGAATAAAGALPFLIPLVKVVMHIGFAIAESGYDVVELLKGNDVPIFKNAETWVCKPTGIGRAVAGSVLSTVVTGAVDVAADQLTNMIESLASEASDVAASGTQAGKEYADQVKEQMKQTIKSDIEVPFENKLQELAIQLTGAEDELTTTVKKQLVSVKNDMISSLKNNGGDTSGDDTSLIEDIEIQILESISDSTLEDAAQKFADNLEQYLQTAVGIKLDADSSISTDGSGVIGGAKAFVKEKIFDKLYELIDEKLNTDELFNKVNEKLNEAIDNVAKAAKDKVISGSDSIKQKLQSETQRVIGGSKEQKTTLPSSTVNLNKNSTVDLSKDNKVDLSKDNKVDLSKDNKVNLSKDNKVNLSKDNKVELDETKKSGKTITLTMNYKEYLYIFTVIGLICNEDNMLERTAQLMAANCREEGAGDDYQLNSAATLVSLTAKGSVKTVFYGAVYNDGKLDFSGKPDRYTFTHTTYMGY